MPQPSGSFDHRRAVAWIHGWVATVDHPELTWAWDAAVRVVQVYAELGAACEGHDDDALPDDRVRVHADEHWADWFAAWEGGDAHYGVHGAMQEFAYACPEELCGEQLRVIGEALDHGWGRTPTVPVGKRAKGAGAKAAAPPPALRLLPGGLG